MTTHQAEKPLWAKEVDEIKRLVGIIGKLHAAAGRSKSAKLEKMEVESTKGHFVTATPREIVDLQNGYVIVQPYAVEFELARRTGFLFKRVRLVSLDEVTTYSTTKRNELISYLRNVVDKRMLLAA